MKFPALLFQAIATGIVIFGGTATSGAVIMPRGAVSPSGLLLVVDHATTLLKFAYETPNAHPKNWIALYQTYYGGPDDERFVDASLTWAYAPGKKGEAHVDTSELQPGYYTAYFLAKDGYQWLAKPIDVIVPGAGPIQFVTNSITTKNARQGDTFEAKLGRLIANPKNGKTKFSKENDQGADWVTVAEDGTISGKPGKNDHNASFVVKAIASDGSFATIEVHIPVRPAGQPLVEELKVMSYNMWFGGTKVNGYHNKQVRFLIESNVDVVGTQESWNGQATRLAQALGWYVWQSSENGIISRYPIVETFPEQTRAGSVRIELDGSKNQIIVWNCHLGFDPYGPYDFCFDHQPLAKVLDNEYKSGRTPQIMEIVSAMQGKLAHADDVPVLLLGDFNAPSHLDWTDATKKAHCGFGFVPWPSSEFPIQAGLIDSFREAHPDPKVEPGNTWSPIYLHNEDQGLPEPIDRIDFVYHKGRKLKVVKSETVITSNPTPEPNHQENEWTSDHKAVLTTYKIQESDDVSEEL